jgi:hypothetical protein
LSCEGLKTHAEQSQLKLDYLRKNLDNLVPLPKPQREDFSNDNEYQQALVAWQKENQKT